MTNKYIPDSRIIKLATNNGKLGLVTDYKDIYMSKGLKINDINPVPKGVYDPSIFGPINPKGSMATRYSKYGCIESPIRYCIDIRKKQLLSYMNKLGIIMAEDEQGSILPFNKVFKSKNAAEAIDYIQYNVSGDKIVATTNITDSTKCSYEGLILALNKLGKTAEANDIAEVFTNKYILVLPIACRRFSIRILDGQAYPNNSKLTQDYRYIIYGIDKYNSIIKEIDPADNSEELQAKLALLSYKLRGLLNSITMTNPLLKGGKSNFSRSMQKTRIKGSMRAVIVPDPNLAINEIGLPLHLAYEMCDKEFIEYLMSNFGLSKVVARAKFNKPYEGHTLDIFSHYIDGTKPKLNEDGTTPEFYDIEWIKDDLGPKYAMINRQPTLHQLSMLSCKVKLTKDNAIKYPLLLCAPLNADFDGDTISVIAINKCQSDAVNRYMSPKNLVYWTKNNSPLFVPTHESMMGAILMTKPPVIEESEGCNDIEEAKNLLMSDWRKKPSERKYSFNSRVYFNGSINITTIGRAILSMIFDNDPYYIENMLLTDSELPKLQLDSKLMAKLILHLTEFMSSDDAPDDREHRIKDLQYWTLLASTKSGATAPKLTQLYQDLPDGLVDEIRKIEEDDTIDQVNKSIRITNIYKKYVDREGQNGLSSELVTSVIESARAKIGQLVEMTSPILVGNPYGDAYVTKSTYITGMTIDDCLNVAISNRSIQSIKHEGVPNSGYLTRQMLYAYDNWYLDATQTDPQNEGILLPAKLADGRTMIDGKIYHYNKSSDEYIRVRSSITSTKPRFVITPDMLNSTYHKHLGDNYQIGASFATSLTEGITQSALGLKHGGVLKDYDPDCILVSPIDGELTLDDNFIIITPLNKGRVYKYPKPNNFNVLSDNSKVNKGDIVGLIPELYTPGIKCDSMIRFLGASGTKNPRKDLNNNLVVSDCYCIKSGTIKYITKEYWDKKAKSTKTKLVVNIEGVEYNYNPNSFYFHAEGDKLNVGDRICSGIEDMSYVFDHGVTDRSVSYSIFRDQVHKFVPGLATELLEFIYTVIFTDYDEETKTSKNVSRRLSTVLAKDGGTYQKIAMRSSKDKFEEIDPFVGSPFELDEMSNRMLLTIVKTLINK